MTRRRNKKQKSRGDALEESKTAESKTAKKHQRPDWSQFPPSQLRADPKLYVNIPDRLRCQAEYASAALLGASLRSIDDRRNHQTKSIIDNIAGICPTVLADAMLAREFLVAADDEMIYREILDTERTLFPWIGRPQPKLISHIPWNLDLALLAVGKSPFFYNYLPEEMKRDNEDLAFATLFGGRLDAIKDSDALKAIVEQVHSCCPRLFSNLDTVSMLLVSGEENVVMTVLGTFHYEIVWDQGLADKALERFPVVNFFLPVSLRNNGDVDVQHVVELLVKGLADVDEVIHECPALLADAAALEEVFHGANARVTVEIVENHSLALPWNQDLIRLAAKVCFHYVRGLGIADKDIEGAYKECRCDHHLPLGIVLSPVLFAATIDVWPEFLNRCPCALVQDDSSVLAALNFMGSVLQRPELLPELQNWLLGFVDSIKLHYQHRESFQTLLKCITRAGREGQEPLSIFPRDVETSNALIRNIFEFLVGTPAKMAEMKYDAFQVVYCLVTLPWEFVGKMGAPSKVLEYARGPDDDEDTFFCGWWCDALAELDEKYNGNPNKRKRAKRNSDDDVDNDDDDDDDETSDEE
jgi:hypothetical protein